jgi:hypothetical protein
MKQKKAHGASIVRKGTWIISVSPLLGLVIMCHQPPGFGSPSAPEQRRSLPDRARRRRAQHARGLDRKRSGGPVAYVVGDYSRRERDVGRAPPGSVPCATFYAARAVPCGVRGRRRSCMENGPANAGARHGTSAVVSG